MKPEVKTIFKLALDEENAEIKFEIEKARKEEKIKIAKNLKKIHTDAEICELTGLSLKTVQNL